MWFSWNNTEQSAVVSQGYQVLAEYHLIEQEQLRNIYAIPSYASALHWYGVIFIHSGFYAESMFRFSIMLPDNFPNVTSLPTVIFTTACYHPHIRPQTQSLDLAPFFTEWSKNHHHIWHLLKYIQAIFADPDSSICTSLTPSGDRVYMEEAYNMEALTMLSTDRVAFIKKVQQLASFTREHMYDLPTSNDPHYIVVEPFCSERHEKIMEQLKSPSWKEATSMDTYPPAECLASIDTSSQMDEEEAIQWAKTIR
ncbi:protein crossbronx-like [Drosophila obscura]|uniref:protein crossbronx-like n=1 Tax=Drosophila obscura TaxID=7282 RepID=UPI001BB201D9|nr:protein crossbronx-like [Drosophila obscura]